MKQPPCMMSSSEVIEIWKVSMPLGITILSRSQVLTFSYFSNDGIADSPRATSRQNHARRVPPDTMRATFLSILVRRLPLDTHKATFHAILARRFPSDTLQAIKRKTKHNGMGTRKWI